VTTAEWEAAQEWEASWWGSCANTFGEEAKQITYAHRMGLANVGVSGGYWPLYDLAGRSVIDLGGGPVSILLKCVNGGERLVVDPAPYPDWVEARYHAAGIRYLRRPAEESIHFNESDPDELFDEAWIYNVLQHVIDPERVVENARASARAVRLFEWIDLPAYQGHLHTLRQADLDRWLGTAGTVATITENGIENGRAYYTAAPT
jgi:hypothetical protein